MLDDHGARHALYPVLSKGRMQRAKGWVFGALICLYVALPLVQIGGHLAVFIDIPRRHFYLFGQTYNAQDFYLMFFVFSGIGFLLIVLSALFGRVWCGWACPQTVFLEGVFRRVERWIEGDGHKRKRLDAGPWTAERVARKSAKHIAFVGLSFAVAHVFLAYFVSVPDLLGMMVSNPTEHPTAFAWAFGMTGIMYFNFWWFREQLCIVICPYGRLQSALQDQHTVVIGYDERRGEPRGKKSDPAAADCVDCGLCVAVCPTGIDIRNGLQLECVGCAFCIDACDSIMDKLERPRGLVRYDSLAGLSGQARRFLRPRVLLYGVAGLVGLLVAASFFADRSDYEANLLRNVGAPYILSGEAVINPLHVHLINKSSSDATFRVEAAPDTAGDVFVARPSVELRSFGAAEVPIIVTLRAGALVGGQVRVIVTPEGREAEARTLVIETALPMTSAHPRGGTTQ